jgi:GTP diphosphokinase / guanosine-3',5'-bis(diphosphate) 3'-diphosphatase
MNDSARYIQAIEYAEIIYTGKNRLNGDKLMQHALNVVDLLRSVKIDDETILISALLHATPLDDKKIKLEITKEFGEEIVYLIEQFQNVSNIPLPINDKEETVNDLHKLFINLSKDIRVIIIRLAERVENIKSIDVLDKDKQYLNAVKALNIYAPLSKAIGINYFANEFETGALKILEPDRYFKIKSFVEKDMAIHESMLYETSKLLERNIKRYTNNYEINSRVKSIYSIHKKAIEKHKKGHISNPDNFHELYDLFGIRIIIDTVENCYNALAEVQKLWSLVQAEYDDYISKPKPNGYRSLQAAVKLNDKMHAEVQIRTFEMHEFNEFGTASHFGYKYSKGANKRNSSEWIKELLYLKENMQTELAAESKVKLFEDTIFVFTPKNDLIVLPNGSTPIDFAYSVHTDLGDKCDRSIVNGNNVSLSYKLKSGDIVNIITNRNKIPSKDWLNFVKSKEAKDKIKKSLLERYNNTKAKDKIKN